MSIQNQKYVGKYQRPEPKKTFRVYIGTDSDTGNTVRFTNSNGSPAIIPANEWTKWKKQPG